MKKEPTEVEPRGPKAPQAPEAANETPRTAAPAAGAPSSGGSGASQGAGLTSSLLPAVSAPKGGGAIRGIGEKFSVNAATGTASLSVPVATSPGRSGFGPELSLSYDSGAGNGPFGVGFSLTVPAVSRKTDKGLPRYFDSEDSDVFILSGAEDLVPERRSDSAEQLYVEHVGYRAYRYRPRVEGAFVRIERCVRSDGAVHWRITTKENVTHVYGQSGAATQIVDPADPTRIFSWLIEESHDDKGNVVRYEYKAENGDNVERSLCEKSRLDESGELVVTAQRYLKRILYGNRVMRAATTPANELDLSSLDPTRYLFEVVFDYGEHDQAAPSYAETGTWSARQDPHSSMRSGFEVRTYRLCQRVMMFHRFGSAPSEPPILVRSTDFRYESSPVLTYLLGVTHTGYMANAAGTISERASLPELTFEFQRAVIHDTLATLPQASLEGLRGGVDGASKQWIDLDGEGIPGVLIDADGAFYYKSNLGQGHLTPPKRLATMPAPGVLAGGLQKLEDLGGDGQLDLVQYGPPLSGYFTRTADGGFETHRTFQSLPNIDWNDPNLRFIDLDGDGHGDLLITEDHAFIWYRSKAKGGFEEALRVYPSRDEDKGPAIVFADGTQSIQLADMSGDGLVDIVRVRNGEVCYWPNLGFGRFGAKITLEQSPVFAPQDEFDARRVRFGDVDGSGTTDIFYLGATETALYLNESGNRCAPKRVMRSMPPVDNVAAVSVVDLLGQGTGCLVWSSPLQSAESSPVLFIDLMGGLKPHLLSTVTNNLGAQTRITCSTSTAHYLRDQAEGLKWLTRLPFPVQVVDEIVHEDFISESRLSTHYRYHHGYFDGEEREFRGFAAVEQWDAERFEIGTSKELDQPPVHTKTWFHTGAWLEKERLEEALKVEYFPAGPKTAPAPENLCLPDTFFEPDALTTPMTMLDEREAARALRGHVLRTEVYADDGTALAPNPYVITEQNFAVRRLQSTSQAPRGAKHGVFFTFPRETLTLHTERHLGDPRIGHELVLEVSKYGDLKRKASVVYGRRVATPYAEQACAYATLTETDFAEHDVTPPVGTVAGADHLWYRTSVQCEQRSWELTGIAPAAAGALWTVETMRTAIAALTEVAYESPADAGTPARRLVERAQQRFYSNSLTSELPLGTIESLALPYRSYALALTPGIVSQIVGESATLTGTAFDPTVLVDEGKYESRSDGYWAPSGIVAYDATRFYLPIRATDPFGNAYRVEYDAYSLLTLWTMDPLGNSTVAENDYRVLTPSTVTDPNLNRVAIGVDALGMVIWTAVMGKATGTPEGDTPEHPTTRFEYHLDNWVINSSPVYVKTSAREVHYYPGLTDAVPWQDSFTYSDGFGRVAMQKVQAEAGPVPGVTGTVTDRWVGTGRTVFNNKGNPVKQYEPFFSATSAFEDEDSVVATGVTPVIHYDPLDRVIKTELPNGTLSRVVFDAWRQENWDPNDNVLDPECTWYPPRAAGTLGPQEQRAATLAGAHANTPSVTQLDTLGRALLVQTDNGPDPTTPTGPHRLYDTKSVLDIEGNQLGVIDALGIRTIDQRFSVQGARYRVYSPDAGIRLSVTDVAGKPLRSWDSRGQTMRSSFDALQRPTHAVTRQRGGATEQVVARMIYGESLDGIAPLPAPTTPPSAPTAAQTLNLRGQTYLAFDGAGLVKNERFEFKGNVLSAARHIASAYQTTPTWESLPELSSAVTPSNVEAAAVANGLETDSVAAPTRFTTSSEYDARNRVTRAVAPDASVTQPIYNRASFLERVLTTVGGATRAVVHSMAYNEKGQRLFCEYSEQTSGGNNPAYSTTYTYDPLTFRLKTLVTRRASDSIALQDLTYVYDPVGNIVEITDNSSGVPIFANPVSEQAHGLYEYDPLYRLLQAEGREHPGQQVNEVDSELGTTLPHANDTSTLIRYRETYAYDEVGNILRMHHQPLNAGYAAWERRYRYAYQDATVTACNRLLATSIPGDAAGVHSATYGYSVTAPNNGGAHGSMTSMPHLAAVFWDYADRMQHCLIGVGGGAGDVYFTYDGAGQRVRKVYVHSGVCEERIYLGGYEVYRRRATTAGAPLEVHRLTLHVKDDQRRVAMAETTLVDTIEGLSGTRWRLQLDNHLGSATLEVDTAGNVISYEEYHPYGTTALRIRNTSAGLSQKRYRYTGKERDEETSLYYHGARYYAPWLGRWTAADPLGMAQPGKPDLNLYAYARGAAVNASDPKGTDEWYSNGAPVPVGTAANGGTMMSDGSTAPMSIPPPEPKRAAPAAPKSSPARARSTPDTPLPPVSAPDMSLYVPEGFVHRQYQTAMQEVSNAQNPLWARGVLLTLAVIAAPGAALEEYLARPIANIPHIVLNSGVGIGEHGARGYMLWERGERAEATIEGLTAVQNFSTGFVAAASVAVPLSPSRATTTATTSSSTLEATRRFFYDPRRFKDVSREYWAANGPANGSSLHHWLIPQRATWIPQGIRNAGFNLVELPALRGVFHPTLGLNQWMGFAGRWGGIESVKAATVEWGIRLAIPGSIAGSAYAGYQVGSSIDAEEK